MQPMQPMQPIQISRPMHIQTPYYDQGPYSALVPTGGMPTYCQPLQEIRKDTAQIARPLYETNSTSGAGAASTSTGDIVLLADGSLVRADDLREATTRQQYSPMQKPQQNSPMQPAQMTPFLQQYKMQPAQMTPQFQAFHDPIVNAPTKVPTNAAVPQTGWVYHECLP